MARLEIGLEVLMAVEHLPLDTRVSGGAGKMDIVVEVLHLVSRDLRRRVSSSACFPACPPALQACCPSSQVVEERDEQEQVCGQLCFEEVGVRWFALASLEDSRLNRLTWLT